MAKPMQYCKIKKLKKIRKELTKVKDKILKSVRGK